MPQLNQQRRALNAEFDMYVGENVLRFRLRRNITQKELAQAAGMDQTVLNRVEIGERSLKFREALSIAKYLNIRVETLTRRYESVPV